jgi:hypothetical protein
MTSLAAAGDVDGQMRRFVGSLDRAAAHGLKIPFWWRDDDAIDATPALEMLIVLARKHNVPLAIAVVPKQATAALAARLADQPNVSVFQHGWRHRNHAPEGEKQMELGDHRPLDVVLSELRLGFTRMVELFSAQFLPVLVPPWNRVSDTIREQRRELGLVGLSTFGTLSLGDPHWINTHLDIFEWRPVRRPLSFSEAYTVLGAEVERRLAGDPEPIGIMTHHLVHEDASWAFLDDLFELTSKHAAIAWPSHSALFNLAQ